MYFPNATFFPETAKAPIMDSSVHPLVLKLDPFPAKLMNELIINYIFQNISHLMPSSTGFIKIEDFKRMQVFLEVVTPQAMIYTSLKCTGGSGVTKKGEKK